MAHEVGHNHGRNHAPCGATAALDDGFPYDGAAVGVWGYDRRSSTFTFPTRKDIMSYCNPQWISDYTYQAFLDRVVQLSASVASSVSGVVRAIPEARFRVLLHGPRGLRWGHPYTGTPPDERRATAIIFDAMGRSVATAEVYRVEIDGIDAEMIAVPEPKPGWYSIQVPGLAAIPF
jgi:hypothetical protein